MTIVNSWESLIVDTKISMLVALGVLDLPLCLRGCEIKMSKLNKQDISETGYYKLNVLLVSNFKIIAAVIYKTRIIWKRRSRSKHFTDAAIECCSSNLCLAAITKII